MKILSSYQPLSHLMALLEARDDFLVQTFGAKLVTKVTQESNQGMQMPADLVAALKNTDDNIPPANKIVTWFVGKDPIQGKGVQWMIVQYTRDQYHLEDIERIQSLVTEFVRVRSQLDNKDLGQYRTIEALDVALDAFRDKKIETKSQARERIELPPQFADQVTMMLNTDQYLVFSEDTHAVARYVASNEFAPQLNGYRAATWCTGQSSSGHYSNYKAQGPIYFILIKSGPDAGKYQFHIPTNQFHIASNTRIPALGAWLQRNEPIRKLFVEQAAAAGIIDFLTKEQLVVMRDKYLAEKRIHMLLDSDGVQLMYLDYAQMSLHPYMMRGFGQSTRSILQHTNAAVPHTNPYNGGVFYIQLPDEKIYTYKLGLRNCYFADKVPYPIASVAKRYPALREILNTLISLGENNGAPDVGSTNDEKMQEMVSSGAAKVVTDTPNLSVWWFADAVRFNQYFDVSSRTINNQLYGGTPYIEEAGILVIDVGSSLVGYQLGQNYVRVLDMEELRTPMYNRGRSTTHDVIINKFLAENPQVVPIIRKYADYYKFFPLMSDKGKNQKIQELEQAGHIRIIRKDGPSVIQLLSPECTELIHPLMAGQSLEKNALEHEQKKGPVFLIQGSILLSPRIGETFQLNSNNGIIAPSTDMVFNRFPVLATLLKDTLLASGMKLPKEGYPLAEQVPALVNAGAITPISANPLVIQVNSMVGARWFVQQHTNKHTPPMALSWDARTGIRSNAYDKTISADLEVIRTGDQHPSNQLVASFGFLDKQKKPRILTIAHRPNMQNTAAVALVYTSFSGEKSRVGDILNTQGSFAYLQKIPGVLEKIVPVLVGLNNPAVHEMLKAAGLLTQNSDGEDIDNSASNPLTKTINSINEILSIARIKSGTVAEQPLSVGNEAKFNQGCYKAVAYLREYADQFTFDQAIMVATRINNMMKFLSKDSLRNMPVELAEWLKYAPQLELHEKIQLVKICPAFIAGIEHPSPTTIRELFQQSEVSSTLEVLRYYAKMDPDEEKLLDRSWYQSRMTPCGVDYNNVKDLVQMDLDRAFSQNETREVFTTKIMHLRNVPTDLFLRHASVEAGGRAILSSYPFPTEDAILTVLKNVPHFARVKYRGQPGFIPLYRRTPKVTAAMAYIRSHRSLAGFDYHPSPVVIPNIAPTRTARVPTTRRPAAAPGQPAPQERAAPHPNAAGFATKAAHARHIIDNRTPDDNRQSLIRRLIDEVGLTPAGASTYYYNLTRPGVREGDESLDLFKMTLRSLWG